MQPVIVHVSDVPEWSALLANIRDWWRSYPWMGWFPGGLFFLAILTFNLWGEGLRRFLAASRISLTRLINRVVVAGCLVVVAGTLWFLRTTSPTSEYLPEARKYDAARAYAHTSALSEFYQGRESGTGGAAAAAMYVADEMRLIGLTPAGSGTDVYQTIVTKSDTPLPEGYDIFMMWALFRRSVARQDCSSLNFYHMRESGIVSCCFSTPGQGRFVPR